MIVKNQDFSDLAKDFEDTMQSVSHQMGALRQMIDFLHERINKLEEYNESK